MTPRPSITALVVLLAASHGAALVPPHTPAQDPPQTPAVFRSGLRVVSVPVSVRASGTPVDGLTAADFRLLDNGVPQVVESLTGEAVPVDVTFVVETSTAMKHYLSDMREQVEKMTALLRPSDRFELIGVGSYVDLLLPLAPASQSRAIPPLQASGLSSINDALVAALLREPDGDHPHLVIALTDTIDTFSSASMSAVADAARHSSAVFVTAWTTLALDGDGLHAPWATSQERERRHIASASARNTPRTRPWLPHYTPPLNRTIDAFAPLKNAAMATGGNVYAPGIFVNRTASAIFEKVFREYRASYVLKYTATGVDAPGWHEIVVSLPGRADVEIVAKRGYFAER
jgi:hypothetical protein